MRNPEIGLTIEVDGVSTNYHDQGEGAPVLLLHGSGPGVSAWANWRLVLPALAGSRRVIAPDLPGFGYTQRVPNAVYELDSWVSHVVSLLDKLGLERVDLVGNSFGGGLSLALAARYPSRIRRLVLMGSVGVSFPMTEGLEAVWGYEPSLEAMKGLLDVFAFDRRLVTDELAELRYQASIQPGFQEAYRSMFPAPRQRWVDALAQDAEQLRQLPHETLVIHGREDKVIPLASSLELASLIPNAQLHVFGHCGHWTQIEHSSRFVQLVDAFLQEADQQAT